MITFSVGNWPRFDQVADVVGRFSLIERDQIFRSIFNKLEQSARHDLCDAADQPFDFLLISGLLSPFKPPHRLPAASVNLTEREKQAIKSGDHTHQSLYTVQQILGHSYPSVTQRYAHLSTKASQEAADSAADVINGAFV